MGLGIRIQSVVRANTSLQNTLTLCSTRYGDKH